MRFPRPTRRRARQMISLSLTSFMYLCMLPIIPSAPASKASTTPTQQDAVRPNIPVIPAGSAYRQTNLISDSAGLAPVLDPLMVNPWGISKTASSPFWVANNGTSTTQLLRGDALGLPFTLNPGLSTVTIPGDFPLEQSRTV